MKITKITITYHAKCDCGLEFNFTRGVVECSACHAIFWRDMESMQRANQHQIDYAKSTDDWELK